MHDYRLTPSTTFLKLNEMPEVYMQIKWPNKKDDSVYSPSSVLYDYFKAGQTMPVPAFQEKITEALLKASSRVAAKYGYECTSALEEIQRIKDIVEHMADKTGKVTITQL